MKFIIKFLIINFIQFLKVIEFFWDEIFYISNLYFYLLYKLKLNLIKIKWYLNLKKKNTNSLCKLNSDEIELVFSTQIKTWINNKIEKRIEKEIYSDKILNI